MGRRAAVLCAAACVFAGGLPAQALDLTLPASAVMTRELHEPATSYFLPLEPFRQGVVPALEIEGELLQQAWQFDAPGLTTLQMMAPLRSQIEAAGYDVVLDCAGQECGGFDFRFNTRVFPAPDMFVDLVDFRFLSARSGPDRDPPEYVTVMVSRTGATGYVQIIRVRPGGQTSAMTPSVRPDVADVPADQPGADQTLAQALTGRGHVVLEDLVFDSGSASLGEGPFASLQALAAFLRQDPGLRVALVGHTDAVGKLDSNLTLSRQRAASVLERLVARYEIPRGQLEAEGMGYLSPVASNLTPDGRDANRRVEAVLLNTE